MTYHKIKETVVDENKFLTDKQLRKLAIRLALFMSGMALSASLLAISTIGALPCVVILICSVLIFNWLLEYISEESKEYVEKAFKLSKFWFLSFILFIGMFVVLYFFRFI